MAIRNGAWLPPTARWRELDDIADQVEEANAAARDEVRSQRAADAHLIVDERGLGVNR